MSTTTMAPEMREVNRTSDEVVATGNVAALERVYARERKSCRRARSPCAAWRASRTSGSPPGSR
jgi:hypothetical protein